MVMNLNIPMAMLILILFWQMREQAEEKWRLLPSNVTSRCLESMYVSRALYSQEESEYYKHLFLSREKWRCNLQKNVSTPENGADNCRPWFIYWLSGRHVRHKKHKQTGVRLGVCSSEIHGVRAWRITSSSSLIENIIQTLYK